MKRLIIAILLTVAVVLTCVFGAVRVGNVCQTSTALLTRAETALASGDTEKAESIARKAADYWENHRELLFVFVNRKTVDDITEQLTLLAETDNDFDFKADLHLIRFRLDRLSTDWEIRAEHIF